MQVGNLKKMQIRICTIQITIITFYKKNPGSEKNDGKTKQNKNENVYAAISLFLVSAFETL